MNTETTVTQERLIGDLRLVIENAEQLLKNTDHCTSDIYQHARAKLNAALDAANEELVRVDLDDAGGHHILAGPAAVDQPHEFQQLIQFDEFAGEFKLCFLHHILKR